MLKDWITKTQEEDVDVQAAVCELRDLVVAAPDEEVPNLIAALTEDPFTELLSVPLHLNEATGALKGVIDRLTPDPEQAETLARRFPISWGMSVWGGDPFDVRVLLNGAVLVRNHHRVLGPALWEGEALEASPELIEALTADLATLRSRNSEGDASCLLLTRTGDGVRLLAEGDELDLSAPGWGQTIAVCALASEDLEDGSDLSCGALRRVGSQARSLVVFLRFFGDRVDLIPASRLDDDLDVYLEELADGGLSENIVEGMDLSPPSAGEELIREVLCRMEYQTEHLMTDGASAGWMRDNALPALARRLANTMSWSTQSFGFGTEADGPRRPVPLPPGVEAVIAGDPDLKRRSVTLEVIASQEETRDAILEGELLERILDALEEVSGYDSEIIVKGRVGRDLEPGVETPPLTEMSELGEAFRLALDEIVGVAESAGEDPDDAVIDAALGVILLVDFPEERPSDMTIAAVARALSGDLEETVRLFLNGRGEYLAYAEGEVDSGDHELFRLDEDGDYEDDEDD